MTPEPDDGFWSPSELAVIDAVDRRCARELPHRFEAALLLARAEVDQ